MMIVNDHLEPTVFVIFGGAGDLTWRKLVRPCLTSPRTAVCPLIFRSSPWIGWT